MAVLKQKLKEEKLFKLIRYQEGVVEQEYSLNKKKLLVGRSPHADIFIDDPHISFYHAFLTIDHEGGKIVDLESDNGIYINGERVDRNYFNPGDKLRFGPLEFSIEEHLIEVPKEECGVQDLDEGHVIQLDQKKIEDLPPDLPPLPGLIVIDGEYCDILFDEHHFEPLNHIPAMESDIHFDEFIDPQEEVKNLPVITKKYNGEHSIEVTVLVQGTILSVDYYPVKNKTYYLSSNTRASGTTLLPCLKESNRIPFIKIQKSSIEISPIPGFHAKNISKNIEGIFDEKGSLNLPPGEAFSFSKQTVQVIIKSVDKPPHLKSAPFFGRDRDFQKETAKWFGGLMGLFLLLLLIDISVDPPKKKIAVIYRKAVKAKEPSKEKTASISDKQDKDTGVKKTEQPKKDVKMAKKTPTPAKEKQKQKTSKKVAKAQSKPAPAPKKVRKAPKMKAYAFKSKSVTSLFGATKNLAPSKVKTNSRSVASTKGLKALTQASDSALKSNQNLKIGSLGKDFSGNYDSSTGTKGLASKRGVNTAYVDPKTVVLGSMDPELLRKILKEYLPQFRHCYQKELERNDKSKGVVDLNFRIGKNGKVQKVKVKGKAKFSKTGSNCMAKVLNLISFPKPKGGGVVDVRQPLNFFSEKDKY
jgi:hypothetical protein